MLIEKYSDEYKPIIRKLNNSVSRSETRRRAISGTPIIVKLGNFSQQEKNNIDVAINEFLEGSSYTKSDFLEYIKNLNLTYMKTAVSNRSRDIGEFPFMDLCRFVTARIDMRVMRNIQLHIIDAYDTNASVYTKEEDLLLLAKVKTIGTRWKLINEIIQKKYGGVEYRYKFLTGKKIANPKTILDEIEKIKKTHHRVRPSIIAKNLFTTVSYVSSVYKKFLKISLHAEWNEISDAMLLLFILKYNHHTSTIIDIQKFYTDLKSEEIYDLVIEQLLKSDSLFENQEVRSQISSETVDERFTPTIDAERCKILIDYDDILFGNIVQDWNTLIPSQKVHKIILLPKIKALALVYDIKTYFDVFLAYKKCIKHAFDTKLLDKFVNMA